MLGWSLFVYLCRRDGVRAQVASTAMVVIVVSSLIGARGLHFISSPTAQFTLANFLKFDEGGLVAYGGLVAGLLGLFAYVHWKKTDGWVCLDNAAPAVALGFGITRVGCFLFGCDYGVRHESFWAIRFPRWDNFGVVEWIKRSAPAYNDHTGRVAEHAALFSDYIHPVQLYESLLAFAAFGILLLWLPAKRFHGQVMLAFLGYYAVGRYALETIRGDADRGDDIVGIGFSTSQLIGVAVLAAAAFLWWLQSRRGLYAAAGTTAWRAPVDPIENRLRADSAQRSRKQRKKKR